MAIVAPWLRSPDVLEAIRGGTAAGLQLRQQAFAEDEALARRQQQAEQFQLHREDAAERLRLARESGAARLAQAAAEAAWLAGHRAAQEKAEAAAL